MGRIAQKGDAAARSSCSARCCWRRPRFPGVFPPVHIEVEAGGQLYQEMHVDGGTTREVFFTIADFRFNEIDRAIGRKVQRRLWIIRNGKIEPEYKAMPETTLRHRPALARDADQEPGRRRSRAHVQPRAGRRIDYNLAAIPADFDAPHPKPFDRAYMQALYDLGLGLGRAGYPWAKAPPETVVATRP